MARIFISYSTPDRLIADDVSAWLRAAGHEPFLDHDIRNGINVGEAWKQRLYQELRSVDAVIGLVTSRFVASTWCSAELGIADALGCRLMPLRIEAGVAHPLMEDLQYADYYAEPQQARDRVLQALRLLEGGGAKWNEGENPFPGLEPFTAALGRVFFGRATEVREVSNRIRGMSGAGGVLALVGPSGCGKSSLLNAALIPLLESDPAWLTAPPLVPGTDPLPALSRVLAVKATRIGLGWSASEVRSRIEADSNGLQLVADDLLAASSSLGRRLLIPIDQAEELFARTSSAGVQRFGQSLCAAVVAGSVQVIAAMRSEFLDDLRDVLAGVAIEAYVLAPLRREMLWDVIEQPARMARLRLEKRLAAEIVSDTGSGDALPLLAFILQQLADGLPVGGTLTSVRYRDLGGVRGALTRHADAALAEAVQVSGLTDGAVLAGLSRLVTVDENGRRSRRQIKLASLPEQLGVAMQVFVDRRLLLSDTDSGGQLWLTLVHEALLTEWGPLHAVIVRSAVALRAARAVEQAAADWNNADKSEHYLWDEERLAITAKTLGMTNDGAGRYVATSSIVGLDEDALAFLDATTRRIRAVKARERRRRKRATSVLSVLLVIALIAFGFAIWQQQVARNAEIATIARGMVAQADRIRDRDPRGALQLGVAARYLDGSPQTSASLAQSLISTSRFRTLRTNAGAVLAVAYAPDGRSLVSADDDGTVDWWDSSDLEKPSQLGQPVRGQAISTDSAEFAPGGRTLATANRDGTVVLWDLADRDQPRRLGEPLTGRTEAVSAMAFAPDGRTLAVASASGSVVLWDLADRGWPRQLGPPLTGPPGAVYALAFAPDGRTLASASAGGDVGLWDLTDRGRPRQLGQPLTGPPGGVTAVAFVPDGRTLVTAVAAGTAGTIILWDFTDRDRPRRLGQPLTGHTEAISAMAFASDGRTLATAGNDQTVRLWDLTNRDRPHQIGPPLVGHTGVVGAVAFDPDGNTLASASVDGTVILWDLTDRERGRQVGQPLTGHAGRVWGVAFAPDERTLASAGADGTVVLWDLTDRQRPSQLGQPLASHTSGLWGVAFSPDGRTLASPSDDGTVILWDLTDRDRPHQMGQPLTGHTYAAYAATFAPDGRTLATAGGDGTVILWDLADRDQPRQLGQPLTGHTDAVLAVAFAPDGRALATAGADGNVILWDLTDRDQPRRLGQLPTSHSNAVNGVAFAPDGRTLATAGADGNVILWDLTDRSRPRQVGQPLTGHTDAVYAVAFAPDGRTLATASADQTVRLWALPEPDRPQLLGQPLTGHTGAVVSVAFAADGRTLATASADQTVRLWEPSHLAEVPDVQAVREACIRAGGALDMVTWSFFASSLDYHDTCTDS